MEDAAKAIQKSKVTVPAQLISRYPSLGWIGGEAMRQ